MPKSKIHVGLEIGTSEVRILVGEAKPDGSVIILGSGSSKSAGVRKGEINDYVNAYECVKDARIKAEDACNVNIGHVFLAVTGKHISGENHSGPCRLQDHEKQIREDHIREAQDIAKHPQIPAGYIYIHQILRNYKVDDFEHSTSPLGLFGRQLVANYHVVKGIGSRIHNSIRCIRELQMECSDAVFTPIAIAQYALDRATRERGALLIDIGGGTTEYVLYLDGIIQACGCLPIGGEHITNDIQYFTELSFSRAENLKTSEGDASGDKSRSLGTIKVPVDQNGFAQQEISREALNEVIRMRITEIFELVKNSLPPNSLSRIGTGVYLSGGSSLMRGLDELAYEIFGCNVFRANADQILGTQESFNHPKFATCLGLIRYAQLVDLEQQKAPKWKLPWPFGRRRS